MAIQTRGLTLDQFLNLPEEEPALEYMHGMVTQKVSPKARHSRLQWRLAEQVNHFAEPIRMAVAFPELRATFAGASPVPDLAVYVWKRLPLDADGELVDDVFIPPDIAFEVLSPGQRVARLAERCRWYVENDVRIGVLVNPRDRSVSLFREGVPTVVLRGDDPIDLGEVLPGFTLSVRDLFAALSFA